MGLVWIWMGDPAHASTDEVVDLSQYHDPDWAVGYGDALYYRANYLLITDNLLDPVHVSFVHPTTLGTEKAEDIPVAYEKKENGVLVTRWTLNDEPTGLVKAFTNLKGKLDRWQFFHMMLPSTSIIDFGSAETGAGAPESRRDRSIQIFACHCLTPETETTTYDHWLYLRNFATDDASVTEGMTEQFRFTFEQDKAVLEAIQREEELYGTEGRVNLKLDAAAGTFRQMVEARIEQEPYALAAE